MLKASLYNLAFSQNHLSGNDPANKLRNNYVIFRHFLVTNKRN